MTTSAFAADVGVPAKELPANLPIAFNWSGFYVGGHAGSALAITGIADPFGVALFGDQVRSPGFIGGGQIGYNYQLGPMVFGLEADVSGAVSDGTNTCFAVSGLTVSSNCRVRPDFYATLAGRFGYAAGRSLFYAKGGAAWTHGAVDMFFNQNNFGPAGTTAAFTSSSDFHAAGWMVGGGIEYALTPAWSAKLEYDYLDFGSHNVAMPYVAGNPSGLTSTVTSAAEQVHLVKFGLNYRFGTAEDAWPAGVAAIPVRAPAFAPVSGWEAEAGARYMFSRGGFQKTLAPVLRTAAAFPTAFSHPSSTTPTCKRTRPNCLAASKVRGTFL